MIGTGGETDEFRPVFDLVRAHGGVAQLCVAHKGQTIVDRSFGCAPDTPLLLFSAGKPFPALLVHLLAERGQLALDDPVARHWPEFGQHGKDRITIRQVLRHRAGVPVARNLALDALTALSWDRSIRAIEQARPRFPAGAVPAYHVLNYGFILGEVVQRVTGRSLRDVLRTEILDPVGLPNTHLGLPPALWPTHVPVQSEGLEGLVRTVVFNRRVVRQAVIPAATMASTARDLTRFYQLLVNGGELDGVRVFAPETIAQARQPSSDGELDRLLRRQIRWSQAFQLGGPGAKPGKPRSMGAASNPDTFGHNGSNCCLAWADPRRQLVFAYLTNRLTRGLEGSSHQSQVSDAVLSAVAGLG